MIQFQINEERFNQIKEMALCGGNGADIAKAVCVMQAVDFITSGGLSDDPECSCPILTRLAIRLNDSFNDEHRQLLKPLIPLLVGTVASDEIKIKRKQLIMWRNVTATYPLILDLFKMPELAEKLRSFTNTVSAMADAAKLLKENKEKIYANAYANAYADAYANALREKIAVTAVETLRLACLVTS